MLKSMAKIYVDFLENDDFFLEICWILEICWWRNLVISAILKRYCMHRKDAIVVYD